MLGRNIPAGKNNRILAIRFITDVDVFIDPSIYDLI